MGFRGFILLVVLWLFEIILYYSFSLMYNSIIYFIFLGQSWLYYLRCLFFQVVVVVVDSGNGCSITEVDEVDINYVRSRSTYLCTPAMLYDNVNVPVSNRKANPGPPTPFWLDAVCGGTCMYLVLVRWFLHLIQSFEYCICTEYLKAAITVSRPYSQDETRDA